MNIATHPRRELGVLGLGLIGFATAFFLLSTRHPASYTAPPLPKSEVTEKVQTILDGLGYTQIKAIGIPRFTVVTPLVDSLQRSVPDSLTRSERTERFSDAFHWTQLISDPNRSDSSSFFLQQDAGNGFPAIHLDQRGEFIALLNTSEAPPTNDFHPDVLEQAFGATSSTATSTADSEQERRADVAGTRQATPVPGLGRSEPAMERIQELSPLQAEAIARVYLERSGWRDREFTLASVSPTTYGELKGSRVVFDAPSYSEGTTLALRVDVSPGGALLSMRPEYTYRDSESDQTEIIVFSIRGGIVILFFLWLLYLLYLRVKNRAIDVRSSVVYAVIVGFAFPLTLVSSLYASMLFGEIRFQLVDYAIQLINIGISAAIISIAFFIVSGIGESVSRQTWSEKLSTLDLIRLGAFLTHPIGWLLIRSVSLAGILLGLFALSVQFTPGLFVSLGQTLQTEGSFLAALVRPLELAILTLILTQSIFLVFINSLKGRWNRPWVLGVMIALAYGVLNPLILPVGPILAQVLVGVTLGAVMAGIYLRWDFLTVALTQFLFLFGLAAVQGFVLPGREEYWIFVSYSVLAAVLLSLGVTAIQIGGDAEDVDRYEPDYIEDLAQEQRMRQELTIAKQVQESFLPVQLPSFQGLDVYARCVPANETGGDYYDFITLDESRLGIIIGDVSGKGIQAAFFMTFIKGVLHALTGSTRSTKEVLTLANHHFNRNASKGMFITLIYGILDLSNREFRFTRAGHNPLLLLRKGEMQVRELRAKGLGVGMSGQEEFDRWTQEETVRLQTGDLLILHTDGIVEARRPDGDIFGEKRYYNLLLRLNELPAREIIARVFEQVEAFTRLEAQSDDMTMIVVRVP